MLTTPSPVLATPRHRVRELVFAYRPLRDSVGHVIDVATLALNTPRIAAATLGPLLRHEPVEVFGVACLSPSTDCLRGTWCHGALARARRSQCQTCSSLRALRPVRPA